MKNLPSTKTALLPALLLSCAAAMSGLSTRGFAQATSIPDYILTDGTVLSFAANYSGSRVVVGGTDGTGAPLVISATVIAQPGVTVDFSRINTTGNGGAMIINPGATLTLTGTGAGARGFFLFDSNTASAQGGALYISASSAVFIDSATFRANKASAATNVAGGAISIISGGTAVLRDSVFLGNSTGGGNGGAIGGQAVLVDLTNVLFQSNSAGVTGGAAGIGGAVFINNSGTAFVRSSTFLGNASAQQGGAVGVQGSNAGTTLIADTVLFASNSSSASNGGAVFVSTSARANIANSLFYNNGGNIGGAIFTSNGTSIVNLTDVSLINNKALNANAGGAITLNGANTSLTYAVSAGGTSQVMGNTSAGVANGIYLANSAAANLIVTVTVGAGGSLDMLDPMGAGNATSSTIAKTGAGVWNLGGTSAFSNASSSINFTVNQGTLHLYRAGETSSVTNALGSASLTGGTTFTGTAATGRINMVGASSFNLGTGATLFAGGGNVISAPTITLAGGSTTTLMFDLTSAQLASTNYSVLTLTAATSLVANGWTQNISLVGLLNLDVSASATYNLLTLTGAGVSSSLLTNALTTFTGTAGLLDGYTLGIGASGSSLQLIYTYIAPLVDSNNVLLWNGAVDSTWGGNNANWLLNASSATPTGTSFTKGDIVNLADPTAPATTGTTTLNITGGGATASAMYVSGNASYTITGGGITTTATSGTFPNVASADAANGKLTLGAKAKDDASGADTVAFTGTLTLSNGTNDFQNGIDINTGVLVGNAANLGAGAPGIGIATGGTLVFSQTSAANYAGAINGAGGMVKAAAGALTLTTDNSGFGGATDVREGSLLLASGAKLGGALRVANAATLGGADGAVAGSLGNTVSVDNGGALQIGAGATVSQTFAIGGDLALGAGSILNYANINNTLLVGGAVTLGGAGQSTINLGTINTGSFALIDAASTLTITPGLFDIYYGGSLFDTGNYTWSIAGGVLWLDITNLPLAASNVLTWTNAASTGAWLGASNWNVTGMGVAKAFAQGDIVNLAGDGAGAITLASSATASAIYVSGTASYDITGAGPLVTATGVGDLGASAAATGKLVLGKTASDSTTVTATAFTGTLNLAGITGANSFTQGVEINSGALRIANSGQLGTTLNKLAFSGTGMLVGAAGSNILFDGVSGSSNRLVVGAGQSAAFVLEDSATMTFTNNLSGTFGGAINVGGGATPASLILTSSSPDSWFVFSNNKVVGQGGAIYGNTAYIAIDHALFASNSTSGIGGAISIGSGTLVVRDSVFRENGMSGNVNGGAVAGNTAGNLVQLSNDLFVSNTAGDGVVFSGGANSVTVIDSSTFLNNIATQGNGGGAFFTNAATSGTFTNVVFDGNRATVNTSGKGGALASNNASNLKWTFIGGSLVRNVANNHGGAIYLQNTSNSILSFTGVLFQSNTSINGNGGALAADGSGHLLTFNDTSFLDNTASASGLGAAVFLAGGTIAYNVTTSATIAGNKTGANASGIYVSASTASAININAGAGAHLDMLDPLGVAASATIAITQTGSGVWNLGGSNNLGTTTAAAVNFTVSQGTLHLYRAGETSGAYTAAAGKITIAGGSFTLAGGATLSAGGGNAITAPSINLASNSTIALDLFGDMPNTTALLTLNATTTGALNGNGWSQIISLLNAGSLGGLAEGATYNLVSLTGATFSSADFFTLIGAPDPSLYSLRLDGTGSILQLYYGAVATSNNVLTWIGAAGNNAWGGVNWVLASDLATSATYTKNDIVNLAGGTPSVSSTVNVDIPGALIAGMSVSGSGNYTITGNPITTASGGLFTGSPAATGALVLGAQATGDAGALNTLAYTGTLTLSNSSNTFTNGIDIRSGALVGNDKTLGVGAGAGIAISSAGSLTFDQLAAATYTAPISGAGVLVKTNTGALTLAAGNAAFTGTTNINAGSIILPAAAALGGAININDAATFVGAGGATAGTAGSAVTVGNKGTLQVGPAATVSQTFSILGDLTLNAGSLLAYASMDNMLLVGGNLVQNGASTFNLNVNMLATGSYSLIDVAGGLATLDTALLGVNYKGTLMTSGSDYLFSADGNLLWLTILSIPMAGNNVITWNGAAADGAWLASANWTALGVTKPFVQGDIVNLAGAAPGAITLAATATTAGMYVSGNASYALSGPGAIVTDATAGDLAGNAAATGKLILGANATDAAVAPAYTAFTGTLDLTGLTGTNTFAQGIELNTGALRIANTAQLGTTLNKVLFSASSTAASAIIAAANSNIIFDSANGTLNRTVLTAGQNATFILEDNATMTFSGNSAANGGAFNVAGTVDNPASLILAAPGAGSQYKFTNNTVTNGIGVFATYAYVEINRALFDANTFTGNGGAFNVASSTLVIRDSTFQNLNVTTNNNGGAIYASGSGNYLEIDNTLFLNNTMGDGIVFSAGASATTVINSSTFKGNASTQANGGGAYFTNGPPTVIFNNVLFDSNKAATNAAAAGGVIGANNANGASITAISSTFINNTANRAGGAVDLLTTVQNTTLTFIDTLFQGNVSGSIGGAIANEATGATNVLNLVNTSLISNTTIPTGTAAGVMAGGAVYMASGAINITVTTSATIAGNKSRGNTADSIYIAASGPSSLNVNVVDGAHLDMLDPFNTGNGSVTITKTGTGVWNLGGISNGGANSSAATNFTVVEGALHLYRDGETSVVSNSGTIFSTAGRVNILGGSFTLARGATLSAGGALAPNFTVTAGGNASVSAPILNLNAGAILAFDLTGAATNSPSLLTLSSPGLNPSAWNQAINLINLDSIDLDPGETINLLNLTGVGTNTLLNQYSFTNLTNVTGLYDGYALNIANSGSTLQLIGILTESQVVTWTGDMSNIWRAYNWQNSGTAANFSRGDIVNLAGSPAITDITVDAPAGSTIAGMYVSGTASYTITGNSLTASATAGTQVGSVAATGKLILGANAPDDASAVNTADYTGRLVLANSANAFQNGIEVRAGALVGNAASLGTGTAAGITIGAAGMVSFDQNADATYASPITGNGLLITYGPSALTLTANNAGFTGTTLVTQGSLLLGSVTGGGTVALTFTPGALGGAINVVTGARFGGSGTAGSVTLAPNATLQVGQLVTGTAASSSGLQTFKISDISLSGGSTLNYTNIANTLYVGGALTQTGASTIDLYTIATGSYALINAATGLGSLTPANFGVTFRNNFLIDPEYYTLTTANNQLWLTFVTLPNNVMTWTNAAGDAAWISSTNWVINGSGIASSFRQGDIVNLAGASAVAPLTIATSATLAGIYVSGNSSYAITGTGALTTSASVGVLVDNPAATGKLVLGQTAADINTLTPAAFTGTLDLTGQTGVTNHFTGGIEIDSGVLRVATTGQLGTTLNNLQFTAGATGTLLVAGNLAFNTQNASNRLVVNGTSIAAILLEDSSTFTISRATGANAGAAINVTQRSTLTLAPADGAANTQFVFSTNHSGTNGVNGGAIAVTQRSTLALSGGLFTGNYVSGTYSGGALFASTNSLLTVQSATFIANTATTGAGGAIALQGSSTLVLDDALITGNKALNGGALSFTDPTTATITNATIQGNTATGVGGAVYMFNGTSSNLTFTNVLFQGNTATGVGGAIGIAADNSNNGSYGLNLTDVSFLDNTSSGNGGAIYLYGSTFLNYNVLTTATIAGNTMSGGASNGIFIHNAGSPFLNFNIAAGATLDMLDPIRARLGNNNTATITKSGSGTWNLGGNSLLDGNNATAPAGVVYNIGVTEGTLHLYRAGETTYNGKPVATGSITITNSATGGAVTGAFSVNSGATLSAGGGNTITASTITLFSSAGIALDLLGVGPNTPAATAILTLNTGTLAANNWTQNLDLLNVDQITPYNGYTYNLITLTKPTAASRFTGSSFNNSTTVTGLTDGYSLIAANNGLTLQLLYFTGNNVLNWTGGDTTANWRAPNWQENATGATNAFAQGDIINLAAAPGLAANITTNLNVTSTSAGIYVSGSNNYTLTGTTLVTAAASTLTGDAVTGKLILGAKATQVTDGAAAATTLDTLAYTGTLTLANSSNNFLGGIEINSGALIGNDKTLGASSIVNNGSLTFNEATSGTYAAPITGNGALNKTGATLTLTGNSASFSGTTNILAGALLLDNTASAASLGGNININPATAFGGAGTAGSVTVATGGTLQAGTLNSGSQTLNLSALNLSNGAILDYSSNINAAIRVAGPVTQTAGASNINIADFWASGTYDLGNLATLYGTAQVTVDNAAQYTDARKQATLSTTAGGELILTAIRDASRVMTWTGSSNTTWALTGSDWVNTTNNVNVFGAGDKVIFNDTAPDGALRTVNVGSGILVSDMIVDAASNYTITGTGAITADAASLYPGADLAAGSATGKLTKLNTGTLTLANNGNNFLGGIDLNEGALAISGSTAANAVNVKAAATLQMTGGILISPAIELAASSTLAGNGNIIGNITLDGRVYANIDTGNTLRLTALTSSSNTITGAGAYYKTGAGTLELYGLGALANTGTTRIDEGTLRLTGATVAGLVTATNNIALNGGNLALAYGSGAVNYTTAANWGYLHILTGANAANSAISGVNDILNLGGTGTFAPQLTGGLHVAIGGGYMTLGNLNNNFTGQIIANSGTLQVTNFAQIAGAGAVNTTKIVLNGGAIQFSAGAPMTLVGDIQMYSGTSTLLVDEDTPLTLTRVTSQVAAPSFGSTILVKAGSGTLTMAGPLQATALTVAEGRWLGYASADGTPNNNGPVTVNAGAVFELGMSTTTGASTAIGTAAGQTYTSTPGGAITNSFAGSGTLEITTGRLVLGSPQTTIEHINVGPDAAIAFRAESLAMPANSTITLDNSYLVIAANQQTLGNIVLKNSSTMAFLATNGLPSRNATLASLASTGGPATLWFNADVTNNTGDRLLVNSPIAGDYDVNVINYGAAPANVAVNIELIRAPASPNAVFNIADDSREIDIGLYKYGSSLFRVERARA